MSLLFALYIATTELSNFPGLGTAAEPGCWSSVLRLFILSLAPLLLSAPSLDEGTAPLEAGSALLLAVCVVTQYHFFQV